MAKEAIDKKYLAGLVVGQDEAGKKTKQALPENQVLDWADLGDSVVIVSTAGQKYRVTKKSATAADPK